MLSVFQQPMHSWQVVTVDWNVSKAVWLVIKFKEIVTERVNEEDNNPPVLWFRIQATRNAIRGRRI